MTCFSQSQRQDKMDFICPTEGKFSSNNAVWACSAKTATCRGSPKQLKKKSFQRNPLTEFICICFLCVECGDDVSWSVLRDLLQQLPDMQHNLLRYLCHFLTLVESNHNENRMTALNLATVFGPNVFRSVGFFCSSFCLCACVR